ncbi:hypothetical protein [Brevundimonas sp. GCM10030266]|uniref:hypothetical protein n=1 Tax=Brevundimonas sp. GCM10030266 TaxID=3273386 RepID=UPI00361CEB9E
MIVVAALSPVGAGAFTASALLLGFLAYCLIQASGSPWNDNDQYVVDVLVRAGGLALLCGALWVWLAKITGLSKASKAVVVATALLSIGGVILGFLFSFLVLAILRGG